MTATISAGQTTSSIVRASGQQPDRQNDLDELADQERERVRRCRSGRRQQRATRQTPDPRQIQRKQTVRRAASQPASNDETAARCPPITQAPAGRAAK